MSFPIADWPDLPAELIAEVRDFVRIDHQADDAAIDAFLRSAASLCEDFTGQMLIARSVTDMMPALALRLSMGRGMMSDCRNWPSRRRAMDPRSPAYLARCGLPER